MFSGIGAALAPIGAAFGALFAPLKPVWDWIVTKVSQAAHWFGALLGSTASTPAS